MKNYPTQSESGKGYYVCFLILNERAVASGSPAKFNQLINDLDLFK